MDFIENMSTLPRHGHLVSSFFADVKEAFMRKELYPLQEQHALVYFGKKYSGDESLVDVDEISDVGVFKTTTIEELGFVQPDFLLFKKNRYLQNASTSRIAGVPDFIVEVWSTTNTEGERQLKNGCTPVQKNASIGIFQDSNLVECWLGKKKYREQNLTDVLVTKDNLRFDLRYLALE